MILIGAFILLLFFPS